MRVCFFAHQLDPKAGWGRLLTSMSEELQKLGVSVTYCLEKAESSESIRIVDVRVFSVKKIVAFFRTISVLRDSFRRVDIVHVFDPVPYGILATIANIGLNKPMVIHAIGTYSMFQRGRPFKNALIRWVYRKATAIIVVSDFVKSQIEKDGYTLPPSVIIPVGVDVERFSSIEQSSSFVPVPGSYILSIGALKERKGFHITIQAFAKIAQIFPSLQLVIVGADYRDGYKEKLMHLAEEKGVLDRVHFLSNLSDNELRSTYTHAELFVMCPITTDSAIEGFGMVYLEANATGLPVVGTRKTGAEEAIQDGKNGYLAEGTPDDVAEKIQLILKDPELRERMSQEGKSYVQRFTWLKVAQMVINVYNKII